MNPLERVSVGITGSESVVVRRELTVAHHKPGMPEVYGTPMMIYLMEVAAANAIQDLLPAGWVSVGAEVNIRHLAATPVGRTVIATARVTGVSERAVTFAVEAHDGVRRIGEGSHVRGAVDVVRFEARLAAS
jgi:predicted thioesterase